MSYKFISTKNHRNGPEASQPLSVEQIAFAEVVAEALVEAWAREFRRRAEEATVGSSERTTPHSADG